MKNVLSYTLVAASLTFTACGGGTSGKSPVQDIDQLRANANNQMNQPAQPVPEKIKYVDHDHEVIKEQATLNANYFKIDTGDKFMEFYEGEAGAYKITLRVLDNDVQMKLTATGLPQGAELKDLSTAQAPNTYELRWTPPYGILASDELTHQFGAMLTPVLISAKTEEKAKIVKGLTLNKPIIFSLLRTKDKPSQLVVSGLPNEIQEGQVVNFSVVARFPGIDNNSPTKPQIGYSRDNVNQIPGSNYLEMDGLRYLELGSTEYLGDFKWKINLSFNTDADHPVQTQKNKDGSNADVNFTQTRFVLKMNGPFLNTPPVVVRVKINRSQPVAPVAAPAQDPAPAPAPEKKPEQKPAPKPKPKPAAKKPTPKPAPKK